MAEELTWLPGWRIRELIGKREISPVEVTDHFLGRIEEHNRVLKAFSRVEADQARADAARAEKAVLDGAELGPLHGVPFSVKEPMIGETASGTPGHEALGVQRIRAAGAVFVGHNTRRSTGAPSLGEYNWDAEARSPWDPARNPGWSSSGGAASAAAGLVPFAIGSDGGGSTRLPAAYSGVFGVHPTVGLVPVVDYVNRRLPSLTVTTGPLSRDVLTAAIALQAMAGPDGRDFTASPFEPPDMVGGIDGGVDGMRFAWTDDYGFTDVYAVEESPRVVATVRDAAQGFAALGATVETTSRTWDDFWPGVSATQFLVGTGPVGTPPAEEVWKAGLDARQKAWLGFRDLFRDHDLLLSPTAQIVSKPIDEWRAWWTTDGGRFTHGNFAPAYCSHTFMFNWLAFPAVSVPCGYVDGLPVGLQIVGLPGSEPAIFRAARAFQAAYPRDEHPPVS